MARSIRIISESLYKDLIRLQGLAQAREQKVISMDKLLIEIVEFYKKKHS